MDTPPVPKPRSTFWFQNESEQPPIPLPRTKVPSSEEKVSASDIFRSISTVSKQITEDVAQKVSNSAKSANERLEKKISDGSKFARGTFEKTLTTSRAMRDSVTRSVVDGTLTSLRKRRIKKNVTTDESDSQRCVSMPVVDVGLFDNIQFHSPLMEQKEFRSVVENNKIGDIPSLNLNSNHLDDLSLFSNNSDPNTDSVSNFSFDSKENEHNTFNVYSNSDLQTYDTPKVSRSNSIISESPTPEVPERRKKKKTNLDVMNQNLHYENWLLPCASKPSSCIVTSVVTNTSSTDSERPSKSTIYEFDPLQSTTPSPKFEGVSNELILLESFLIGDTYGSIISNDSCYADETFDEYKESDYFNPPTPPERSDSLFADEINSEATSTVNDSNTNWFLSNDLDLETKSMTAIGSRQSHSVIQKFSSILKLDHVLHKPNKPNTAKVNVIEKPPLNDILLPYYSGMLTRNVPGVVEDFFKNSQSRYSVLSEHKLLCYTDPTNSVLKEAYNLENVSSLQIVLPLSSSTSNNSYCFELMFSTGGLRNTPRKIQLSCSSASDRRNWVQKISEHLTRNFPTKYTAEFTRCGWCFLKEGVSGEWRGAWIMLVRRVMVYYTSVDPTVRTVDLRKTRCVVTQEADNETKQACPSDCDDNLVLDCPHATIYLRLPYERELKAWKFMIKLAAHNNGAQLHHQQLTKEDVPAIVDKCLSFVYAHGTLSEGIYRRAGSNAVLAELLARFRRDAWSVQLSPGQHSEHDVSGVLKRFFRDLPEPLIPQDKQKDLTNALRLEDVTERHLEYRNIMKSLPLVTRNTVRKLFAHLHFLHTMAHVNKMGAENLAAIWGPNIMPGVITTSPLQAAWSSKEMIVLRDLITNFEAIWEPTDAESRREAAVRRVLIRVLSNTAPTAHKAAGDLKAWIYVHDKSSCFQVALTPNKTCGDVCIELCEKAKSESHLIMIEEVVCSESLRRTVHVGEILLDVVLRWGYWDEEDRKDNYLLLKENKILQEIDALKHATSLVCGELKFANDSTKTFKSHMFEFQNGKLCYFKDKQGSHKIEEWNIKDILWYIGHEPKRNPQSRWAITFIPKNNKNKRSKDRPWFGNTIAGSVTADQLKWMTAMMFAEHTNILPVPRLVIT